jgi:hypothetical protein
MSRYLSRDGAAIAAALAAPLAAAAELASIRVYPRAMETTSADAIAARVTGCWP